MQKLLISVTEFCEVAGVGRTYANDLIRRNRVTSVKLGGRRLVVLASVQQLIDELVAEQAR